MSWSKPPRVLRKCKLDNLALVPGSLLPFKKEWQQLANQLPPGSTLIIIPSTRGAIRATLQRVSETLKARGRSVTTLPREQFPA